MENEIQTPQPDAEKKGAPASIDNALGETASIIEKADAVAKRMEEANKKAEELLKRQEAVAARIMLSGRADAGQTPSKTPEQEQNEKLDADVKAAINRYR